MSCLVAGCHIGRCDATTLHHFTSSTIFSYGSGADSLNQGSDILDGMPGSPAFSWQKPATADPCPDKRSPRMYYSVVLKT